MRHQESTIDTHNTCSTIWQVHMKYDMEWFYETSTPKMVHIENKDATKKETGLFWGRLRNGVNFLHIIANAR